MTDPFGGLGVPAAPADSKPAKPAVDPFGGLGTSVTPTADPFGGLGQATAEPPTDLVRGVLTGIQSGLAPQTLTKADYKDPKSTAESLVSGLADALTGVGVAAAGTAALGAAGVAAAPAVLTAGLLYGLYSGLGREWSRSEAEDKPMSLGRAALAVGLEANPVLRTAKPLVTALRVLGQVAGSAGLEYAHSEDRTRAASAAVVGAVLSPLMFLGMRKPAERTVQGFVDAVTEDAPQLARVAAKRLAAGDVMSPDLVMKDRGFKALVAGMDPSAPRKALNQEFRRTWEKLTPERKLATVELFQVQRAMLDEASQAAKAQALRHGLEVPDLGVIRRAAAPALYVARKMDRLINTDLEGAIERALVAKDRYTVLAKPYLDDLAKLERLAHTEKVGPTRLTELMDQLHKGARGLDDLAPNERKVIEATQDLTTRLFEELKANGYAPEFMRFYLPQLRTQGADLSLNIRDHLHSLQRGGGIGWDRSPEAGPLRDYAAKLLKKPASAITANDLMSLPERVMSSGKTRAGYTAGAVFERSEDIAAFERETDAFKLLARYVHGNLKAAVLDPEIKRLQLQSQLFGAVGAQRAAEWTDGFAETISGVQGVGERWWSGAMERVRRQGRALQRDNPGSTWATRAGKVIEHVPEALAYLNSAIYPAKLGLNLGAAARNSVQNYVTGAPELSGTYGYSAVTRAYGRAAKEFGLDFKSMERYLQQRGQLGDFASEAAVRRGVMSKVGAGVSYTGEAVMRPFRVTDAANRVTSLKLGEIWAEDLLAGHPAALRALTNASPGLKSRIGELVDAGLVSKQHLGDVLGAYLISKTQFRYGAAAQSAVGRQAGSAFTQFTMWPQMAAWDLIELAERAHKDPAVRRQLAYKLAPLFALMAAKEVVEDVAKDDESPTGFALRYFVGDPTQLSPYPSALSGPAAMAGGPAIKAAIGATKVAADLFREESAPKAIGKAARDAGRYVATTWVPGLSSVLSEFDRMVKAMRPADTTSPSRRLINRITGKED